jgi:DNA invertase Pin-like site-specific DNA recombinase
MRYSYARGKKASLSDKAADAQKAVLYMRVSTKEQEAEGFSIPAQRRLLEEYARKQGFQIAETFEDVETAKRSGRKAFQMMLDYLVVNPQVRHLLVEKTDRLYRNFEDHVKISHLGLNIHLVKEGELLNRESKSHQKLVHGFKLLMAKNFSDNLSEEVTKGMLEKARGGDFPVRAPVGYLNDRNERSVVIDPVRAPLVRQAFELYATGNYSLSDLRKKLIQDGFTLKNGNPKPPKSTIEHMLKNPFYYGAFRYRGDVCPGNHTAIVTRELYEKVRGILSRNKPGPYQDRQFGFIKFMTCAHCGCAITAEIKKGKYVYYRCSYSKGKCQQKYVPEAKLIAQFGKLLQGLQLDERFAEWVLAALAESERDARDYHKREISRIQNELVKIEARIEQM